MKNLILAIVFVLITVSIASAFCRTVCRYVPGVGEVCTTHCK